MAIELDWGELQRRGAEAGPGFAGVRVALDEAQRKEIIEGLKAQCAEIPPYLQVP